jgi:rifampicin phosphotransferase
LPAALFRSTAQEIADIGGKAYHLAALQRAGFRVPDFFALSRFDVELLFGPVIRQIDQLFEPLFELQSAQGTAASLRTQSLPPDPLQLQQLCGRAQALIHAYRPANDLLARLHQRCVERFGPDYCIAIRSSAIAEDSAGASFAGQHASFLFTTPETLLPHLQQCLASAWSFGALSYRLLHALPIRRLEYAMVLQQMVLATRSGIAFSMNVHGNMADAVINCGYGVGEGIVLDQVAADTFLVNRAVKSISKKVIAKTSALRHIAGQGMVLVEVAAEQQLLPSMTDAEIHEVYDSCLRAEKLLGLPADIEFSWGEDGRLYLLQMRPITTVQLEQLVVLDNTNIVESYPGITLPLSFSFAQMAYARLFRRSAKAFWISSEKFDANQEVFGQLIEHFYGRVYYRLDHWYRMMALVYNSKKSMQAWERAVGLPDSASDSYHFSLLGKVKTLLSVIWLVLRYKSGNRKFFKHFASAYDYFRDFEAYRSQPAQLWAHLERAMERTFAHYHYTLINDYLAFKAFGWLQAAVARYKISEQPEFANELVVGQGEVESELAILSFLKLKAQVVADAALLELFQRNPTEVLEQLEQPTFATFYAHWQQHLQRFGDRCLAELKLETRAPRRHPELLVQLVQSQLEAPLTAADFKARQTAIYNSARAKVQARLQWWMPHSWWFYSVWHLARYGLANRENMRFCRTRIYGAAKDIFLALADGMVASGQLESRDEVFYLSMQELQSYAQAPKAVDLPALRALIAERKQTYAAYEKLRLPDRIIYQRSEKPDFSAYLDDLTAAPTNNSAFFQGTAVSKGIAEGEALVITEPVLHADVRGKILVSKMTDPGWVFLMSQAIALITEKGSLLSHTAIVGRELGIPVVVGVQEATQHIKSGDRLRVNGSTGRIDRLD